MATNEEKDEGDGGAEEEPTSNIRPPRTQVADENGEEIGRR